MGCQRRQRSSASEVDLEAEDAFRTRHEAFAALETVREAQLPFSIFAFDLQVHGASSFTGPALHAPFRYSQRRTDVTDDAR